MPDLEPTRLTNGDIKMMAQVTPPSIGRTVLFTPSPGTIKANGAAEYVAVIGQVFDEPGNARPYCNLLVFAPFQAPYWHGSVQEADGAGGPGPSWRWPPRV